MFSSCGMRRRAVPWAAEWSSTPRRPRAAGAAPKDWPILPPLSECFGAGGIVPLLENSPQGMEMQELVRLTGLEPQHMALPPQARIVDSVAGVAGPRRRSFVILDSHWQNLGQRALHAQRAFHLQAPDEPGIDRGRLRRMTVPTIADGVWRALIDELVEKHLLEQSEHWLHLPEHRVTLNERERTLAQALQAALAAGGFDPPWVRDLALSLRVEEEQVRAVLRKCMVQREVYQVVRDHFYHRDSIRALARELRRLYERQGLVEAARYRDAIGLGRKRSIQVLEFFDRVGYTRRGPKGRVLRADSSWHETDST